MWMVVTSRRDKGKVSFVDSLPTFLKNILQDPFKFWFHQRKGNLIRHGCSPFQTTELYCCLFYCSQRGIRNYSLHPFLPSPSWRGERGREEKRECFLNLKLISPPSFFVLHSSFHFWVTNFSQRSTFLQDSVWCGSRCRIKAYFL